MRFIRLFQEGDVFTAQSQIHGADSGIEVRNLGGTNNRRGNTLGQRPGKGYLRHGHPKPICQNRHPLDDFQVILLGGVVLLADGLVRIGAGCAALPTPVRQVTARQRRIWNAGNAYCSQTGISSRSSSRYMRL